MMDRECSEEALVHWGRSLGASLGEGPVWIGLRGPLGAGKSVLARAIARGLGVEAEMPSPTYNLVFEYAGRGGREVAHLDLYRLESPDELVELGWEDLGARDQVVLVEWPERAGTHWPAGAIEVTLAPVPEQPALRRVRLEDPRVQPGEEPSGD